MKETNSQYFAQLFFKLLQGQISPAESQLLMHWLEENPDVFPFLREKIYSGQLEKDFDFLKDLDKSKNWELLKKNSHKKLVIKSIRYWILPLAACLICVIGICYYFIPYEKPTINSVNDFHKRSNKLKVESLPALEGAELLLSSGQAVILSNESQVKGNEILGSSDLDTIAHLPQSNSIEYHTLFVKKAQFYKIQLQDGTLVWLNANSQLDFPSAFDQQHRTVKLKGEAYFEVAHQKNVPFYVLCTTGKIKVLGTKFSVKNRNANLESSLLSGSIQIENQLDQKLLSPNQKAILRNGKFQIVPADLEKDLAWKNNRFIFKNDKLRTIFQELGDWYNVEFSLADVHDFDISFSGEFSRKITLSQALSIIGFSTKLDFQQEQHIIHVQ